MKAYTSGRRGGGRPVVALVFIWMLFSSPLSASEIIEFRSGSLFEGEVAELTADTLTLTLSDGATMTVALKDLTPFSVYRIRSRRLAKEDGQGHWDLATYCLEQKMYAPARKELAAAVAADPKRQAEVDARLAQAAEDEAQMMFDQARALLDVGEYQNALKGFQLLLARYPKSPLAAAAQKAITDATTALKAENDKKAQALELAGQKAAAAQQAQGEAGLKARFDTALKAIEDGKTLNVEGLDAEGETKVSRADRAYQAALAKFEEAGELLDAVLTATKDADLIAAAKDQRLGTDRWRVITCDNLANLWAVELNLREAMKWCNRALAIDPADHVATELKLEVTRQMLRRSGLRTGTLPPGTTK